MLFWHRIKLKHTFALIFYVLVLYWKQTRSSILIPMVFYTFYSFVQDIPLIFILKKDMPEFSQGISFYSVFYIIPDTGFFPQWILSLHFGLKARIRSAAEQ